MGINKIRQIVRLKQVMHRWRNSTTRHVSTGQLPVDVGPDQDRFTVPARFINLPIFISLLNQAREDFGYQHQGVLSLPSCDPALFRVILGFLDVDEDRYGRLSLDEFAKFVGNDDNDNDQDCSCKDNRVANAPLLQNA